MIRISIAAMLLVACQILGTGPALAAGPCATPEQLRRIQEFYAANPATIPVIAAQRLGLPDAVVVSGLAAGQSVSASGSAFAEVWAAMTGWRQANFLIMKGRNVFEILSGVGPGKPSERSDYFNIAYEQPLRGHLRPDLYASVYAIDLPNGEETPIRGVLFFDEDAALVFGAFISGESLDPPPAEMQKFETVWQLIRDMPSVCPEESGTP